MPRRRKPEYVPLGLLKQLASVQDTSLHLPSAFPLAHGATSQLSLRPTAKATAQRGDQPCCLSMIAKGRTNAQLAMHRDVRHKQGRLRDTKGTVWQVRRDPASDKVYCPPCGANLNRASELEPHGATLASCPASLLEGGQTITSTIDGCVQISGPKTSVAIAVGRRHGIADGPRTFYTVGVVRGPGFKGKLPPSKSSAPALSSSSAVAPGLHPATAAQHSSSPSTPAQPTPDPTSAVPAPSSDDPASSPSPPSASQQPAPAQHDEPAADQPPTTPAGPKRKKRSPSTKTSPEGNKKKGKADEGDEGEHTEHEGGEGAGSGTRD